MAFNSIAFLVLAVVFFGLWPLVRHHRTARLWTILTASCIFYGWWDWRFLPLMLGTGTLDWGFALCMDLRPRWRKPLLVASLVSNLGALAFFKYANWGIDQANVVAAWFGMPAPGRTLDIVLPVGISFYTFQSLSYTIDVYRRHMRAVYDPIQLLAYLSLFPQLVAGPIVRAVDLLPQMNEPGRYDARSRWEGLVFCARGFFKKCVIADQVAPAVNAAFGGGAGDLGGPAWWIASILFAAQIYADFSGYSDIAKGLARWMGYRFPDNFRTPYLSSSPKEFWSRWHISLSTWFRDYLYVPLGGSRRGHVRTLLNLTLTMLISGLWHGANWTFLAWGAWHAAFLLLQRVLAIVRHDKPLGFPAWMRWAGTMLVVLVGWVFFRAANMTEALTVLRAMALDWRLDGAAQFVQAPLIVAMVGLIAVDFMDRGGAVRTPRLHSAVRRFFWRPRLLAPVAIAAALLATVLLRGPGDAFIYFQF
ncbi:MAG: MBOAT family O-acyltransferase [Phycisphaerales bacterium]